ncbi:GATA transcription factor 6-like [Cornus florida]|uniref:GATA transcription factor 6-like n=1 Tax=Cornus florida TaxID=4283 RepID=UPI002898EACF|nr:GATA transcription factor 6-like [Cornus florida]
MGPNTLCNARGVQNRSGCLFPEDRPTTSLMKEKSLQQHIGTKTANPMKEKSLQQPVGTNQCTHCGITKSPQWRKGPMRRGLCNTYGIRYNYDRLFPEDRPTASHIKEKSLQQPEDAKRHQKTTKEKETVAAIRCHGNEGKKLAATGKNQELHTL